MSYNGNDDVYRKRPINVRAWQVNSAMVSKPIPHWVLDEIGGRISHPDVHGCIQVDFAHGGRISALPTDWIIKDEQGRLLVQTDRDFRHDYERVFERDYEHG